MKKYNNSHAFAAVRASTVGVSAGAQPIVGVIHGSYTQKLTRVFAFAAALIAVLCAAVSAQPKVPVKNVAVIETQIDDASGAKKEISKAEVREITTEIRRIAVNSLPRDRYQVMTSETVLAMGADVLEKCAEENCVIALGSKIGADYIVRGTINKFQKKFSLNIEMYDTEYGMLVASAASVRTTTLTELLDKGSAACAAMYKSFLDKASAPLAQAAPPAPSAPPAPTQAPVAAPAAAKPAAPGPAPATPAVVPAVPPPPPAPAMPEIEMVLVKGGTFEMGCTKEQGKCDKDERPTSKVTLDDFYIGKFEVTQKQWNQVMGSVPSQFKGEALPVEMISWYDVQTFITKLNQLTGKKYRLPSEAEWEYAARGGDSSKAYRYAGSNKIDEVAWFEKNSEGKTHPVGNKKPNELGIHGMSGNVLEWVNCWFGPYTADEKKNPDGPASGTARVIRGGSWDNDDWSCRISFRFGIRPDAKNALVGFRLAHPVE